MTIVLVKICYKLLYDIQAILIDDIWPQLISKILVAYAYVGIYVGLLLIGPALFYTKSVFVQHITTFISVSLLCASI